MKLLKIFSLLLLVAAVGTSCSDDDFNTNSATVKMGNPNITWKETAGLVYVPMVVEGETNGPVRVTVEVKEEGSNPAKSDVNYMLTSNSYVFGAEEKEGGIELKIVDDREINEDRTFSVRLVKAEGATISSESAQTMIALKDNDANFYEKFAGKWTVTVTDLFAGAPKTFTSTIITANEGDEDYNKYMYATNYDGQDGQVLPLAYSFDVQTKEGSLNMVLGAKMATFNFTGLGIADVVSSKYIDENTPPVFEGQIEGKWNEDFTEIRFNSADILWGSVLAGGQYAGAFFAHADIVFSR